MRDPATAGNFLYLLVSSFELVKWLLNYVTTAFGHDWLL
jgi:hypothetical protein